MTIEETNNITFSKIIIYVYRSYMCILGGAVSDKCNIDSAFYYRNTKYIMTIQTVWTNNIYKEENIKWLDRRFNYLYSITEGSYVNFPYDKLKDYEREYYGENKERLRVIKNIYDPLNIFNYQQSIL